MSSVNLPTIPDPEYQFLCPVQPAGCRPAQVDSKNQTLPAPKPDNSSLPIKVDDIGLKLIRINKLLLIQTNKVPVSSVGNDRHFNLFSHRQSANSGLAIFRSGRIRMAGRSQNNLIIIFCDYHHKMAGFGSVCSHIKILFSIP